MEPCIGVRWTLGDVSERGFVALSLSVAGAVRLLGDRARYVVCVNNVPLGEVRRRLPRLPEQVELRSVDAELPPALARRLAPNMAQGVAWKFAPPRLFPDRHELALDNDCILWDLPDGLARWLERPDAFLLAEDVAPAFGRFAPWCGPEPRNTGIRGLPRGSTSSPPSTACSGASAIASTRSSTSRDCRSRRSGSPGTCTSCGSTRSPSVRHSRRTGPTSAPAARTSSG